MRSIGLIGGVGPLATTSYYLDKVVAATEGCLPDLLMQSLPINTEIEKAFIYAACPPPEPLYKNDSLQILVDVSTDYILAGEL